MSCPERGFSATLERASGPERAALLEHARACARCRAELLAGDPSRLFSLLSVRPVPLPVLDALSREVSHAIRAEAGALSPLRPVATRRALAWAAALLLAVASGSLFFLPEQEPETPAFGVSSVEVLSSPGAARVVDLTVGETQLVMIFNEEMKL